MDCLANHKLGFLISGRIDNEYLYIEKIDDVETFAQEKGYDFKIPKLNFDKEAKEEAKSMGYEFNDDKDPLRITGYKRDLSFSDIVTNNLRCDVDCPFDDENNKIDVYSSVYWTAETKEDYEKKENIINSYIKETDLFRLNAWCDISGFEYWVKQQNEDNYVSIDVVLKKPVEKYTQEEIKIITNAIIEADEYFEIQLN